MNASIAWARQARRCALLFALVAMTGCSSMYVDGTTKEIAASQYKRVEPVHPVQLLFDFQTRGVPNARATALLKARVIEQVKTSGLFSAVSEEPVRDGALLGITLDNVPLTDDAFTKGFVTGLTFGLAGSQVSDGYVCTVTYSNGLNAQPIVKNARHAIHTTVGASAAPGNAVKAANIDEAVALMTRQIISNVLHDLTLDSNFK